MAFNLTQKVYDLLVANKDKHFTAREIATHILNTYPADCTEKRKNSNRVEKGWMDNDDNFIQQIVAEIGSQRPKIQKKHPEIKTTEERPKNYFFEDSNIINEKSNIDTIPSNNEKQILEHDLYPIISEYLLSKDIYSMRIDERKSSNTNGKNGNKWLHPDIVGVHHLCEDYNHELKNYIKEVGEIKTDLYSYEVKLKVSRSNVREVFFQTVSNSSWANYSYLVCMEITSEALEEFKILSSAHNIGLISIDINDLDNSIELITALKRDNLDYSSINRLIEINPDFKKYIKEIKKYYQTGDINKNEWIVPNEIED